MPQTNITYDYADKVIKIPDAGDVKKLSDPDEYMNRINEISTPSERLMSLAKSLVDFNNDPSHEAFYFRNLVLGSTLGSFTVGGILKSRGAHENFVRRHNASVFENRYLGNRLFWDILISGVASNGLHYGFKAFIFSSSAGLVTLGSMAYRAEIYWPDWVVGFTAIGAISRLWIGTRGMAAGGLIGGVTGLTLFGLVKSLEFLSGKKYQQLKLIDHKLYLERREDELRRSQKKQELAHMEYLREAKERGDL